MTEIEVATVTKPTKDVIAYLKSDVVRNALDIWCLLHERNRYELRVCRIGHSILAHIGIFDTPEANYTGLGGTVQGAEALLPFIPHRAVLLTPPGHGKLIERVRHDFVYPNDIMALQRGEERLETPERAQVLTTADASQYSSFGTSFNAKPSLSWAKDRLRKNVIFGVFHDGNLVSIASLGAWLPEVAVILAVETKPAYRGKGFGSSVVSAAVREALIRSGTCSLFVRSDNKQAIGLYRRLGFRKVAEELWVDIGTGMIP